MISKGEFPKPVRIGRRAVAWPESVVRAWQTARPIAGQGDN
ncbi:helix-turn-helix transcriptional regulator [Yoonia sp. I 8.24]